MYNRRSDTRGGRGRKYGPVAYRCIISTQLVPYYPTLMHYNISNIIESIKDRSKRQNGEIMTKL